MAWKRYTVKLGNKEHFDKEQIGIKELFMDEVPKLENLFQCGGFIASRYVCIVTMLDTQI